ncbi:MAG: hypothetical protein KTR30_29625 [Saprospiraceae bacterium]|nr:hypothetical protein [Saprospiraceae bacterium]
MTQKHTYLTVFLLLLGSLMMAQEQVDLEDGTVSFLTSKNVYVKFASTKNINTGDTLYRQQGQSLVPALVIVNKSSSSTVCTPIGGQKFEVKDQVVATITKPAPTKEQERPPLSNPTPDPAISPINNDPVVKPAADRAEEEVLFKEKIKGRISVASYNNLSNNRNLHRMRYAFSFRGYNLNDSRLSIESYVTFRHQLNDSVRLGEALKVYALSAKYSFDKTTHLTFGRKINPKFSSMGAIDGLQFEKGFGNNFSMGVIAGTRPDLRDYGLNVDLLQFGAYASFATAVPSRFSQSTVGFIEQMNRGNTDRRFAYFQHSSTLAKNLNLFGSFEIDLFEKINEQVNNQPRLTNLFAALRYRVSRKLRFSASYDNRRNIIYYESYRNFIDQLIEDETRQGLRFGFHHRPFKTISWGINSGVRFQKSQRNPSRNLNGHVTFSRVPYLKARVSLRANLLQTDFIDSQIFGIRINKSLIRNKLDAELFYRWVDYKYKIGDRLLHQNIAGASLSMRLQRSLSLHLFYEGISDNTRQIYHRFNARIIKRF